jgi:hypothetical protein
MKKTVLLLLLALVAIAAHARLAHLLPRPQQVSPKPSEKLFPLGTRVVIDDPTACPLLREVLEANGCRLVDVADRKAARSVKGRIVVRLVDSIEGAYDYPLEGYENEAYRLDIG